MEAQPTMRSALHWDHLAEKIADDVAAAIEERVELRQLPIDVLGEGEGPFISVFADLLRSRLVERGLVVSAREEGLLALPFRIRVLAHDPKGPTPSEHEVVVTATLVHRNRFVVHSSAIAYIHDPDAAQYGRPLSGAGPAAATAARPIGVVQEEAR